MNSLAVPSLDTLRSWLGALGINFYECGTCLAFHLPHMQNMDGVFDAKIDLVNNIILFSAQAEVKPSSLLPLSCDLSAINASSLTVKAFLDIEDDNLPRLVVCQSLSVAAGVTFEQFAWFLRQSEEQIVAVILEASSHHLLCSSEEEDESDDSILHNHFIH